MTAALIIVPSIFRAYDIRGEVGVSLTTDAVYWIGRALAAEVIELGDHCINLAWDGRLTSPDLAEYFQRGVLDAGVDVVRLGAQTTGLLYFSTFATGCSHAAMITGSHNPVQDNGIKPVLNQTSLSPEHIQRLYQRIMAQDLPRLERAAQALDLNLTANYIERLASDIQIKRPLKVVVDAGNGIAGPVAIQLMQRLGVTATFLYCEVDGRFPNHHPDPGVPENIQVLRDTVLREQADVGIGFDGDGDRVALVDSAANIIWPDRLLMLLCQDVLPTQPKAKVIYDVKSSGELPRLVKRLGGEPVMTPTGHSIMKRALKEQGALLGGEFSGHLYIQHRWYGFDDGLYAAARLLEVLSHFSCSSAEVFARIPEEVSTPEITLTVGDERKFAVIEALKQDAELLAAADEIFTVDGLRLEFPQGWGLVRASNTTPKLTLRFAGQNIAAVQQIQEKIQQALNRLL